MHLYGIAKRVYSDLLVQLNGKCKYIRDLRDVEVFFDQYLSTDKVTAWYCLTRISLPPLDEDRLEWILCQVKELSDGVSMEYFIKDLQYLRGESFGASCEIPVGMGKEDASKVIDFIREISLSGEIDI